MEVHRGDIFIANLKEGELPGEQGGQRPIIVSSNELANQFSPAITGIPVTSILKKTDQKTHVLLGEECGLKKQSMALVEASMPISKERLIMKVGECTQGVMERVDRAIQVQMALVEPFSLNKVAQFVKAIEDNTKMYQQLQILGITGFDGNSVRKALMDEFRTYCKKYGYDYNKVYSKYKNIIAPERMVKCS